VGTFLTQPTDFAVNNVQAAYMIFLKHTFDEIRNVIEEGFNELASSYAQFSASWRSYLNDRRSQLYKSIAHTSKESYLQWRQLAKDIDFKVCPCKPRQSSTTAFDHINLETCQRA
jgi:hypothetical protein